MKYHEAIPPLRLHPNDTADDSPQDPSSVDDAIRRAVDFFRREQKPDGHWVAELEGDALLQSETILLLAFLGEEDSVRAKRCARRLVQTGLSDGGWEMYPGAGADVTNSVKGYFALKLTGHDPASPLMRKTREKILSLGGADAVNSFTRFFLALLGQIPYSCVPAVPPQMILLPKWSPINIYSMSSWSRTIFVPLSIVSALQPVRVVDPHRGIRELMVNDPKKWGAPICPGQVRSKNPFSWDFFFRTADRGLHMARRFGVTPFRKRSIRRAKEWTMERFRKSDGPGAIQPPILWAWVAMVAMGYPDNSPEIEVCRREFDGLVIDDLDGTSRVAPCKSPVWDTTLVLKALRCAGVSTEEPMMRRATDWLLDRQTKEPGDWNLRVKRPPGGWAFEYNNEFYPDNDDTAMALMVLAGRFGEGEKNHERFGPLSDEERTLGSQKPESSERHERHHRAVRLGRDWLLAMQNKDGGWGAFDKGCTKEFLCRVPFADHNAMIDPSTSDITGRVLESLGRQRDAFSRPKNSSTISVESFPDLSRPIQRGVTFLKKSQLADGSWFGRWGVNYLYGTWQALTGLSAAGVPASDETVRAGANWLLTVQHENGGWGESADSYHDPSQKGKGKTTASQTAWSVMGLIAAGLIDHPAVARGVAWLVAHQNPTGRWDETEFTGTGFPQVFYLKYHYYAAYFPLMALALYVAKKSDSSPQMVDVLPTSHTPEKRPIRRGPFRVEQHSAEYFHLLERPVETVPLGPVRFPVLFYPDEESFDEPVFPDPSPVILKIFAG